MTTQAHAILTPLDRRPDASFLSDTAFFFFLPSVLSVRKEKDCWQSLTTWSLSRWCRVVQEDIWQNRAISFATKYTVVFFFCLPFLSRIRVKTDSEETGRKFFFFFGGGFFFASVHTKSSTGSFFFFFSISSLRIKKPLCFCLFTVFDACLVKSVL